MKQHIRSLIATVVEARTNYRTVDGVTFGRDVRGIETTAFAGNNLVHTGSVLSGDLRIGYATTIGAGSRISGPAIIGNWCQLAPNVSVIGTNHPTSHVSTYVNRRLLDGLLGTFADHAIVDIGHDVWLGDSSIVLPGVRVSTGAVVGAAAVVTKDVPPYAIVVGNPARVVRSRLPDDLVDLLLATRWWELTAQELEEHRELFTMDLAASTRGRDKLIELADKRRPTAEPRDPR